MRLRLLSALVLAQMAFSAPLVAQAHSEYDHSDPASGATVATAPTTITVTFTQELTSSGSSLEVRDATNTKVDAGNSQVASTTPKNTMTVGLKTGLPPGLYTVTWKTRSADDGDEDSGTFSFGVGVPAPAVPAAAPAAPGQKTPDVFSGPSFDATGTVVSVDDSNNTMEFLTSDITGRPTVIRLDIQPISKRNISKGESMTLTIGPRSDKLPQAWTVVSQGSYTEGADFSPNQNATQNESSSPDNRPDDDEARNKQHHEKGKED
jgi:methionine-rich copper-binding protein CopC